MTGSIRQQELLHAITVRSQGHWFGVPLSMARDVFVPTNITPVPLAPAGIAGVLNLRGRIVAAIDLGKVLGLKPESIGDVFPLAIMLEQEHASHALLIDEASDVVDLSGAQTFPVPGTMSRRIASHSADFYAHGDRLITLLDPEAVVRSCSQPTEPERA